MPLLAKSPSAPGLVGRPRLRPEEEARKGPSEGEGGLRNWRRTRRSRWTPLRPLTRLASRPPPQRGRSSCRDGGPRWLTGWGGEPALRNAGRGDGGAPSVSRSGKWVLQMLLRGQCAAPLELGLVAGIVQRSPDPGGDAVHVEALAARAFPVALAAAWASSCRARAAGASSRPPRRSPARPGSPRSWKARNSSDGVGRAPGSDAAPPHRSLPPGSEPGRALMELLGPR